MGTNCVGLMVEGEPEQDIVVLNIANPALNIQVLTAVKLRDKEALSIPLFPKIDDSACAGASPSGFSDRLEEVVTKTSGGDLFEVRVGHQTIGRKANRMAPTIMECSEDTKEFIEVFLSFQTVETSIMAAINRKPCRAKRR